MMMIRNINKVNQRCQASLKRQRRSLWGFGSTDESQSLDLRRAVDTVRKYDPAGFLPGILLPNTHMRKSYFAVRSFWLETGLRNGNTANLPMSATPEEQLDWWADGADAAMEGIASDFSDHPTLRLLESLGKENRWSKKHFDYIIQGRRLDLETNHYETLDELVWHAETSCGSLFQLVMESGNIREDNSPMSHAAAKLVGQAHGVTNALRLSIPVVSTTGRLIIPKELLSKYGVKSPRYLLSALSQGDTDCLSALEHTVEEIVEAARKSLGKARELRPAMMEENPDGTSVLLPALASEAFLDQLEGHSYRLTDRDLRNAGVIRSLTCSSRIVVGRYNNTF